LDKVVGTNQNIAPDDRLSRSVHKSEDCHKGVVQPTLFAPNAKLRPLAVSVIRSEGMDEPRLWNECEAIACQRQQKLYGRADLKASVVTRAELEIDADTPTHANILGWEKLGWVGGEKQLRLAIQLKLAQASQFIKHPAGVWLGGLTSQNQGATPS
jgi:hypothetical protein